MKLMIAIVQDKDAEALLSALTQMGYRATKMASTGGFLREGNSTVFLGVEDNRVEEVLSGALHQPGSLRPHSPR
jgi:uncharacterized protein YaaQ